MSPPVLRTPMLAEKTQAARRGYADLDEVIAFQDGSAEALPFPTGHFDLTMACTMLEEVDARRALAEIARVTKPLKATAEATSRLGAGMQPQGCADARKCHGPEGNLMIAAYVPRQLGRSVLSVLAGLVIITPGLAAADSTEAWAALVKGGHVAVIRHGNAPPGYRGDPPGFRFDDCKTQRNLDDIGREQARALGEAFRKHGVRVDRIVSSPVCRCGETGQLMALGSVETSWALLPDTGTSRVRFSELKEMVSSWRGPGTLVLVTHALTVRPLTGFLPEQAETVVLQPAPGNPGGGSLVGRIAPPRMGE